MLGSSCDLTRIGRDGRDFPLPEVVRRTGAGPASETSGRRSEVRHLSPWSGRRPCRVASSADITLMESFWSTIQCEPFDRRRWQSEVELASAIFE